MSNVVDAFQNIAGVELRVVATLTSFDYEVNFIRDDLVDKYGDEELDNAYKNIMAIRLSAGDFSKVGEFGELDCQMLLFNDIIVFLFSASRYGGLFVSFDRKEHFPLFEVVDTANDIAHVLEGNPT